MKFPSVKNLAQGALITIKRFPFEVLFALAGTIAGTVKIELTLLNRVNESWCARTIMIANLGLLLSLSASLYSESKGITGSKKMLLRLTAAVLAILLIFIINPGERESDYIRFFLFSLSFHLLVAFAAFTVKGHIQGFWQFNKTLFLRFLTSALYSAVLFLGLAAAIGAMNFLFNFKFEWDTFAILWAWIVGMFSTLFFLSGVPADIHGLDEDFSYPKGLKVFTQYVLIPLATVYVAILLAYEIKILVQWQLPKGMVSHLILGYAVFGILSLLLVYPIREQEENKWLKTYTRSFYFLLIPLLGLLFTAAGTRVFRYGITEMRYFLILLACWLLFITIYFLVTKKQNIKLIPISLSIVTLFSIYGPQSAFRVSMFSQRRVLVEVFKKNNAFKDGRLTPVDSVKISRKDGNKAVATLDYLIAKHDLTSLQPYFKEDLGKVSDSLSKIKYTGSVIRIGSMSDYELRYAKLEWAKKRLGLGPFSQYGGDEDEVDAPAKINGYTFANRIDDVHTVRNYDYMVDIYGTGSDTAAYTVDGIAIKKIGNGDGIYTLQLNNQTTSFNIRPYLDSLIDAKAIKAYSTLNKQSSDAYVLPDDKLVFTKETKDFGVTLKVDRIGFSKIKTIQINYIHAYYLIKRK
ncbi:DUF4153 domain-containing protein [Mucilaginibacter terrigena]|uniref:DUF4153 domain-containing protein n=1 Tax=Mucilaginibacter terrigena TaxID=2492395 RepID=A0A4Q5LKJ7_9SPHI|nr:DUF4153 domain-containing protein [Mucilaginibacter terrigena]RYU87984.1 DUF4153 domain-containing protein [Mucilaginibacter terrigena]